MRFPETQRISERNGTYFHAHRFLLRAGLAIGNVFAWVFVFEYFFLLSDSLTRAFLGVLLVYALSQLITIFLTPLAALHLTGGTRRMLIWGLALSGSAFVVLGATLGGFFDEEPAAWGITAFAVLLGAYRALYFIPYELNRSENEQTRPEGKLFYEVLLALMPAFAGATLVLKAYAPLELLFGGAVFIGLSILPLFSLPDTRERFSFSYTDTFRELFDQRNSALFWSSFLEGVQGAALFLVWPLAVFLFVGWSYMTFGIVFTVTLLLIILFRMFYRAYLSKSVGSFSAPVHVIIAMSGWVGRLAAGTPLAIIIADSYAHTARSPRGTLADPFSFEHAADNGSFIDEHTALKEMALAGGRIALLGFLAFIVFFAPLAYVFGAAFLLAALAAGISVMIARKSSIPAY